MVNCIITNINNKVQINFDEIIVFAILEIKGITGNTILNKDLRNLNNYLVSFDQLTTGYCNVSVILGNQVFSKRVLITNN